MMKIKNELALFLLHFIISLTEIRSTGGVKNTYVGMSKVDNKFYYTPDPAAEKKWIRGS